MVHRKQFITSYEEYLLKCQQQQDQDQLDEQERQESHWERDQLLQNAP